MREAERGAPATPIAVIGAREASSAPDFEMTQREPESGREGTRAVEQRAAACR